MILDRLLEFADAVALSTAAPARSLVGNVIPLSTPRDIGVDSPLYLVIQVDTPVTSGGAATVSFELTSDAQAAIAVDGSATVHVATGAIPKATLVAGYEVMIPLPMEDPAYESYLGLVANIAGAALTAGKINAFLTVTPRKYKSYPHNV